MWRGGILLVIRRLPSERVGNRAMSGPRQHRIVEELRKQFPKLVRAFQSAVERGAPPTMPEQVDYSRMTVNERLFSAGILKAWDAAAESRYRKRMVELLSWVGLADHANQIVVRYCRSLSGTPSE